MASTHVDIMLIDGDLPDRAALALCAEVSGYDQAPRIIMLSVSANASRIVAALRAGAVAWVPKDESAEHLLQVISRVAHGESWVPPSELGHVFQLLLKEQDKRGDHAPLAVLTPRERDVLSHVAAGANRKEVARQMHLSVNTVRTHMQSLMSKLGVHSALEAVALTRSWVDEAQPDDHDT
jgi:DNA-binding NarL/FixJ family response regulator